jgi:hypothetical protein
MCPKCYDEQTAKYKKSAPEFAALRRPQKSDAEMAMDFVMEVIEQHDSEYQKQSAACNRN